MCRLGWSCVAGFGRRRWSNRRVNFLSFGFLLKIDFEHTVNCKTELSHRNPNEGFLGCNRMNIYPWNISLKLHRQLFLLYISTAHLWRSQFSSTLRLLSTLLTMSNYQRAPLPSGQILPVHKENIPRNTPPTINTIQGNGQYCNSVPIESPYIEHVKRDSRGVQVKCSEKIIVLVMHCTRAIVNVALEHLDAEMYIVWSSSQFVNVR